jgi:3D (Asp-Asp-Asp) domain-containing protein
MSGALELGLKGLVIAAASTGGGVSNGKSAETAMLTPIKTQVELLAEYTADLARIGQNIAKIALNTSEFKSEKAKHNSRITNGLGGIAQTGFSNAQYQKVKHYGHGDFSGSHDFYVTTYGPPWDGIQGTGETSTGVDLSEGGSAGKPVHEIAVDPAVIPYGSLVTVWPNALHYRGPFLAADTGGAIIGNHVDVYDWKDGGYSSFSTRGAKVEPYIPASDHKH